MHTPSSELGLDGSYGHHFKHVTAKELVHFFGVVVRDGVHGGSNGALHRQWQSGADYDDAIVDSMKYSRWLQIKRVIKLCDNHSSPKRGEPNYDPGYKYDLAFKSLVANVNAVSHKAELDICGDETTWAHGGYGEKGSGITGRVKNKPISKGGQVVIVSDVHRVRPRAYLHRHKVHTKPPGWTAMGPLEVHMILEKLRPMCVGEPMVAGIKQIFHIPIPRGTTISPETSFAIELEQMVLDVP
jgi:hypothetical protein